MRTSGVPSVLTACLAQNCTDWPGNVLSSYRIFPQQLRTVHLNSIPMVQQCDKVGGLEAVVGEIFHRLIWILRGYLRPGKAAPSGCRRLINKALFQIRGWLQCTTRKRAMHGTSRSASCASSFNPKNAIVSNKKLCPTSGLRKASSCPPMLVGRSSGWYIPPV